MFEEDNAPAAALCLCVLLAAVCVSVLLSSCQRAPASRLMVLFPNEAAELVGGQLVRVTLRLENADGHPVEGATAVAELWSPDSKLFASLPCHDNGLGRYVSEYLRLPLRGSEGNWQVLAQAEWGKRSLGHAQATFSAAGSYSERLEDNYGFWIEPGDLFELDVPQAPDPAARFHPYADGGGYVMLANTELDGINERFVMLDVHWRQAAFPSADQEAVLLVQGLAGPHGKTQGVPDTGFEALLGVSQGRSVWRVTAPWVRDPASANPPYEAVVEWMVLECPGSQWLWTVVIATNDPRSLPGLRAAQETFCCPESPCGGAQAFRRT